MMARSVILRACLLVAMAIGLLPSSPAHAQEEPKTLRGVALVIGQSEYEHLSELPNPANDADAIETLLSDLGFDSTRRSDRKASNLARDLERFAEDAEGADVAILYYSGHGIEAGGENFLIPVDADLSALDDAGEQLVPLSAIVEKLKATVPVVIVMLDACRDNPFPPGSTLRLSAGAEPVAVGNTGLGLSRSAVSLKATSDSAPAPDENVGTVIAFAAEPGKVALDGAAGSNSPYAAAVIRHFDAMAGEEFSMVMRMVAEEVYLKTGGRQRPWINESLRRLLYFGEKPGDLSGDEGDILRERRQLLVTIAALPDSRRSQVENIARQGGVPMDALYGMLRALGKDVPDDPVRMEEMLKAETGRVAKILSERAAVTSPDPEIVRLSALADNAEREGLLSSANNFRERAKARYLETEKTLLEQEAALDQRFIEGAEAFARSAETKQLSFNHLGAAQDYAEAFRRVEKRDSQLAWQYKSDEMVALIQHGDYNGDNAMLEQAIAAGRQAIGLAQSTGARENWAVTQNDLGIALWTWGERTASRARLEESIAAFHAALEVRTRDRMPQKWAGTQNNLGNSLRALGGLENGTDRLEEAVSAYRSALEEWTRERAPLEWALTQNNLGVALAALGVRQGSISRLEEAIRAYRAALNERSREKAPLDWAMTQNNLGSALWMYGALKNEKQALEEALDAFRAAQAEFTRERMPQRWALTQNNIGLVLRTQGVVENDAARLEAAIAAYLLALEERTQDQTPQAWAQTQSNLGTALWNLGEQKQDSTHLEAAVAAFRAALQERTRERVPLDWAGTQNDLANALQALGEREAGTARLTEAVEAYRAALGEFTRERLPLEWAKTTSNLGGALVDIGKRSRQKSDIEEGRDAISAAWQTFREAGYDHYDDYFRKRVNWADEALAGLE